MRLFTDMKEQGLQPDRVAYNALLSALRVAELPEKAVLLWQEMMGKQSSTTPVSKFASAEADSSLSPDIITVTDVLATLVRAGGPSNMQKVDEVFAEAVERGIVLGENKMLDSRYETDLSGMSLPVARACVRFILNRVKDEFRRDGQVDDVFFITGIGSQFLKASKAGPEVELSQSLRDHVQTILTTDFVPPVRSLIPQLGPGMVMIEKDEILRWLSNQC
jgi:pentatricopeptide repeat protein